MHGNVSEWVRDWYGEEYYADNPEMVPAGPADGSSRVRRGGNWHTTAEICRSGGRQHDAPDERVGGRGFRLVLSSE